MKTKRFLFLLVMLIGAFHYCISQALFDKRILQPSAVNQLIQADHSGNLYVVGTDDDKKLTVTKFDSAGNFSWGKKIWLQIRNYGEDFLITENQRLIIAVGMDSGSFSARRSYLMALDTAGNFLFSKVLDSSIVTVNNMIQDSAGFTACLSHYDPVHDGFKMIKFDYDGNILYERMFEALGLDKILKLPDGSYLTYDKYQLAVCKVDPAFSQAVLYTGSTEEYKYSDVAIGQDGLIYIASTDVGNYSWISCTDTALSFGWTKNIYLPPPYQKLYFSNLFQLPDRSWIIVGSINAEDEGNNQNKILIHADTSFSVIKAIKLPRLAYTPHFNSRTIRVNDYFVFTAPHVDSTGDPLNDYRLIKTDSSFEGICNYNNIQLIEDTPFDIDFFSFVTLNSVNVPTINHDIILNSESFVRVYGPCDDPSLSVSSFSNDRNISVWPNPSKNKVMVGSDETINYFELFDIHGVLLKKENVIASEFEIDLSKYSSGIYFLTLIGKENQFHKKIIKE